MRPNVVPLSDVAEEGGEGGERLRSRGIANKSAWRRMRRKLEERARRGEGRERERAVEVLRRIHEGLRLAQE